MDSNKMDQCQVIKADSLAINNFMMGPSMALMGMIFGTICVLALYTMGIFFIGYTCGSESNRRRGSIQKMTMTPVTYTAVRKVQHPQFEYSPRVEGCWDHTG